jgi:hypothetical protein
VNKITRLLYAVLTVLPLLIISCNSEETPEITVTATTSEPVETSPVSSTTIIPVTEQTTSQTPVVYNLTTGVNPPGGGSVSAANGLHKKGDKIYITATPYNGYVFDHWSGDVSANGSTIFVLMNSDKALVANFIDVAPPVISNVLTANITDTGITIRWDTNKPATSQLEYGTTTDYGSNASDNQLTSSHAVTLTGLQPDTVYQFRIKSVDKNGNISLASDGIFNTTTRGAAVTSTISSSANGVTYSIINTSSKPIKVVSADLLDSNGITRHTNESLEVGVPYIRILSPGNNITETFSLSGQTYSGWRVIWYCKDINYVVEIPFTVTSNTLP